MRFIGIDPGVSGGLALHSPEETLAVPMPTWKKPEDKEKYGHTINWHEVYRILSLWKCWNAITVVEKVWGRGGWSAKSNFGFGGSFVSLLAALQILGAPYVMVTSTKWQKAMLDQDIEDTKEAAMTFCQENFPTVSLLPTPRSKKPHDGMSDALVIAAYGATQYTDRVS